MRRSLADAILKAYNEFAKPNLTDDMPNGTPVQILVTFSLGDLRSLERTIRDVDELTPHATRA